MKNVGDRVIAVLGVTDGVVKSFGEGVYAGNFPLPDWAVGFNFGQDNPRIDLDSGKTVWGCECWWGPANVMHAKFKDMKIEIVDPDEVLGRKREAPLTDGHIKERVAEFMENNDEAKKVQQP